jgi:hypothetical protein
MPSSTVSPQVQNFGASINIISGIQGVSAGGQASINMPVNQRIHRETYQCSGIAYGLNGTPTAVPTAVDAGATFSLSVTNGVITGINITGAVSTKAAGTYPLTISDANYTALNGNVVKVGQGATGTYTVNGANVVTAAAITSGGTVSVVPPELFFTSQKRQVNGVVIRDMSVANTVRIARANSYVPADGEYPVFFTEPWRKIVDHDQATAWDLFGQSTYQIIYGISSAISSPQLTGTYEFDYLRNARRGPKGEQVLFLRPIKHHTFTYNVPAGVYNITSLPIDFPIQRMWLNETGKGSITQIELYQDGNKVMEGTFTQADEMLKQYEFNPQVFDYNVVFDPDQRLGKALKVSNALVFRVYSAAPTALNVNMEIQADNYV